MTRDIQKHRTRHTAAQLRARHDADAVLRPDGTFDLEKHRHKAWMSVVLPGDTKPTSIPPVTAGSTPSAGAADIIVTPGNPSDYGATVDGSSHAFIPPQTSVDDGKQGALSDCYAIAAMNSIAIDHGDFIRTITAQVGSLCEHRFIRNGQVTRVRVDETVDTYYTPFGVTGALYPITFLKAYAYYRTGANTVASLNLGWSGNVFADLGLTAVALSPVDPNAVTSIMAWLSANQPVCVMSTTNGSGKYLPTDHEVSVIGCQPILGSANDATLTLVNQWGYDGGTVQDANPNDGIITVKLSVLAPDVQLFTTATGFPVTPITGPTVPVSSPIAITPASLVKTWSPAQGYYISPDGSMLFIPAKSNVPVSLPAGTYTLALTACDANGKSLVAGSFIVGTTGYGVTIPATKGTVTVTNIVIPAGTPLLLPVNCNFYALVATPSNVTVTPVLYTVSVGGTVYNNVLSGSLVLNDGSAVKIGA